jgi:putative aldouronate transport system substrate-binding protein
MSVRKLVFVVLSVLFVTGSIFAGGRQDAGRGTTTAGGTPSLHLGVQTNAFVSDYKNNYLTRYLEDLHKINLDFYLLPADAQEVRTKISLMVASDDLTDVLLVESLTREQILDYGSKGAFIPLNRYLNDPAKAPHFAKVPEPDKSDIITTGTMADGNIYSLPRWEAEPWNMTPHRYYLNKAWLDKLGLKVPATTDELRNVLIAFRDRDPNGNGRKDEIGITGWFSGGYGENVITALLNSFIFYNQGSLALDASGNTVTAPFTDPAFRKGLQYLNQLFKDGVLSASTFTDNQQQFRAILNVTPPVVGLTSAGSFSNWSNYNTSPNFIEMDMVAPFTGPDGVSWTPYTPYVPTQAGFITSKCKDEDLAFRFLEAFFDPAISTTARYGEEGVDWTKDPEELKKISNPYVEMGIVKGVEIGQMTLIWSQPSTQFWHNMGPRWAPLTESPAKGSILEPYDPSLPNAPYHPFNYRNYLNRHPDKVLPLLSYTVDDAVNLSGPITDINEYVRQSIAEFATGVRDINANAAWDNYLKTLNDMGLQAWLRAAQVTYNRQK